MLDLCEFQFDMFRAAAPEGYLAIADRVGVVFHSSKWHGKVSRKLLTYDIRTGLMSRFKGGIKSGRIYVDKDALKLGVLHEDAFTVMSCDLLLKTFSYYSIQDL